MSNSPNAFALAKALATTLANSTGDDVPEVEMPSVSEARFEVHTPIGSFQVAVLELGLGASEIEPELLPDEETLLAGGDE